MSWLRSAINKAAEVGGKNIGPNLSRTVRNVAQQAGHAVAGGAKLVQDRLVGRNLNNSRIAIKRLNEVALNARGSERVQALTRWLGALKEIGKEIKSAWIVEEPHNGGSEEIQVSSPQDDLSSPRKISKVLFYDFEGDGEPMNFREIFLRSRAIENIVLSMILEGPADEEVSLLLEIFGLCLAGGKELHIAIISSIQDLAKAFSIYPEEIMGKKEELLGYAQNAIGDLKLNAELERLEVDITTVMQLIHEKQDHAAVKEDGLNKTKELIQLDIQLRNLLQRKAIIISQAVNGQAARTEKVEQLRNLSKSLEQAVTVAVQQISENRNQKEEALKYRVAKAQEVSELEKVVAAEVKVLEQKRSELEAQLKEVKASLAAAMNRHINIQEEKEQFDEASAKLVAHLAIQEEDLTRSVVSHKAEVSVLGTWISFLEDTWQLKASCTQQQDKNIWDALNGLNEQFLHTIVTNLSYHHEELCVLLKQLESCSSELKDMEEQRQVAEVEEEGSAADIAKQKIQEKYLDIEGQVINILRIVELLKDEVQSFASLASGDTIELDKRVLDAFDSIAQKRKEFEAMQRPDLEIVDFPIKTPKAKPSLQWADPVEQPGHEALPPDANFDDETFLSEIANMADNGGSEKFNKAHNGSKEDTEGWEFDELEEELKRDFVS